ncbi:TPA: DUF4406 domain-containing protein [Yersinia enterocolitica]|nr:DUF4406 domain-containing protein [Yersinia enterocolitica]
MSNPRKAVVFIAGPMTGYPNFNRDEFNTEAGILEEHGFIVLNPAVLPDGLQHGQYLDITLAMLAQADAIFLLDGWEKSKGAMRECGEASRLGLLVIYQSWESLQKFIEHKTGAVLEVLSD